jgi:hypothetical protein
MTDAETEARNERLNTLRDRTEEWADAELDRLEYEKEYLESVLSGRSPSGQLQQHLREFTSALVQDELDEFLETS